MGGAKWAAGCGRPEVRGAVAPDDELYELVENLRPDASPGTP